MISESNRKLLTIACGECWHEFKSSMYFCFPDRCLSCGKLITSLSRRTFTTADDWELVREKVVLSNVGDFHDFIIEKTRRYYTILTYWLLLSIEDRMELALEFIKERPHLFPEVLKYLASLVTVQPSSTQIASGKKMPWEKMPWEEKK